MNMLFRPFVDQYINSCYNPWTGNCPMYPLQVYNEVRYGKLNNLDYRQDIGTFEENAHSASVNTLSLDSIENRYLLSGSSDSSIKLWDLKSIDNNNNNKFKPIHVFPRKSVHSFGITDVKWWPDNGMWLSSSYDFKLNLYDSNMMDIAHSFKLGSRILNFEFDPTGNNSTVICCLDGGVGGLKLVDLRTLSDTQNIGGGGKSVGGVGYMLSCAWSPSNSYLCVGGGIDGSCYGWDIRSSNKYLFELDVNLTESKFQRNKSNKRLKKDPLLKNKAHYGGINSILFNEFGNELFTLGNDEKLRIWDMCKFNKPINKSLNFGPLIRNKSKQHIKMCLSPVVETEVSFLWVPSDSGEILVYRVNDGSLVARLNRWSNKKNQRSYSIVCSGQNMIRYYSGCKDGSITVWGHDDYKSPESLGPIKFDNGVDPIEDE